MLSCLWKIEEWQPIKPVKPPQVLLAQHLCRCLGFKRSYILPPTKTNLLRCIPPYIMSLVTFDIHHTMCMGLGSGFRLLSANFSAHHTVWIVLLLCNNLCLVVAPVAFVKMSRACTFYATQKGISDQNIFT